jgi:hypothetical protein
MYSIYKYFINLLIVGCAFSSLYGQQVEAVKNDTTKHIRYNGFRVDVDVSPIITSFLNKGEVYNYEAAVQVNLNNKFYPVFEMGYSGASKTTTSDINYQGEALFYRLGLDFNLMKQKESKKKLNNVFLFGGRLGFSNFSYDLTGIQYSDDYWGAGEVIDKKNILATKLWFEIVAGIRVEIAKNIFLGWTVRTKSMLTKDNPGDIKPWHVPGYGINSDSGVWGFNYTLGYKF